MGPRDHGHGDAGTALADSPGFGRANAVDGFFQGKGVRYWETGEKMGEGTFVDGQFHGAVIAYFHKTNRVWTKWIYKHGIRQSMTTWHANGRDRKSTRLNSSHYS